MKIFETFKNIIDDIQPELCWFTTFNLNIELVEKYVLAAIAGKEPSELKRAEDFEALNTELEGINIKVWYDYRALDLKQAKRTTVDLIPVNAAAVLNSSTQEPIFHPKVIFLKGKYKAYLITGSFNLSIAGWSSNRECIVTREIKSQENAFQIIEFFKQFYTSKLDYSALDKWATQLPTLKTNWKFAHNFNTANILKEIKGNELHIWSPYFSKSTSDLMGAIKSLGFNKIGLVPDISLSHKVRILPEELLKLQKDAAIQIWVDQNIIREKQTLFHAKVWLTENTIAIGSWNCSYRALGMNITANEKNIEAGIIESINSKQRASLLQSLAHIESNTYTGTEAVELDNEWEDSLGTFSFCCNITANWETFKYEFELTQPALNFTVSLPHNPTIRISLNSINVISFIDGFNRVLKNKLYTVYNEKDEIVFIGYLNEIGKKKRPTEGYVSFYDLFASLTIDPLKGTNKSRVVYLLDDDDDKLSDIEALPYFSYSGHESYYMMFVAFQKLIDSINLNKDSVKNLEELGYRLPGSLINIKSLFNTSLLKALEVNNDDDLLFHYFLGKEINECIKLFEIVAKKTMGNLPLVQLEKLLKMDNKDLKFIEKAMAIK